MVCGQYNLTKLTKNLAFVLYFCYFRKLSTNTYANLS